MSPPTGRLWLVPNTLDFGVEAAAAAPVERLLPREVIEVAAGLGHWAAENAKTTRAFLKRVAACIPLARPLQDISIAELPRPPKGASAETLPASAWDTLLEPARQGHDLGLISEAGLPALADPGAHLVRAAHRANVPVVALPGASAVSLALAASGLNGQCFAFVGYVPADRGARLTRLRELEAWSRKLRQTQLLIETPYRNAALLDAMLQALQPGTEISVSVALTTAGGHTRTGTVADWRRGPRPELPADLPVVFALLAAT